ncbi:MULTISPECIES: four helix bundle protein [unclassified Lebetimonas]|uniref:four helix bundle protein n=1 Tax=unclassified Lebetimonas TaxID=2648158 RepID=UPI0004B1A951|nr:MULTISPECIES: four helix bundle protein [unclassified Lebetimonas]
MNKKGKIKENNLIVKKSYEFALEIAKIYKYIIEVKKEYIMSKQLLRCGTSIGANVQEAQAGITKKDFIAKMSIAAKEARETRYWIKLLIDSGYFEENKNLLKEIDSIINILTKIIKTSQQNQKGLK